MAPKFALFTKGSRLPLNKGFKNMFEVLQSCAQPSIYSTVTTFSVCVEVLQPSQPNGVMSSTVSLPFHVFTGQA